MHKVPAELPENGHRRDGQPFQIAGEEIESKGRSRILRPDVKERPVNPSLWHFGDCPKISSLQAQKNCVLALTHAPQGAIDLPIRSLKKTKKSLYLSSGQGTLRLTPLAPNMIRVQFKKGEIGPFKGGFWERAAQVPPVWNARAGKSVIQVETKDLIVSADKRTGALSFLDRDGKILVAENPKIPRWIGGENREQTWNYFDWEKNEKIYAKGILPDDRERMNNKARYISFGGMKMRMPWYFPTAVMASAWPGSRPSCAAPSPCTACICTLTERMRWIIILFTEKLMRGFWSCIKCWDSLMFWKSQK